MQHYSGDHLIIAVIINRISDLADLADLAEPQIVMICV
jgi:hypothetical protein